VDQSLQSRERLPSLDDVPEVSCPKTGRTGNEVLSEEPAEQTG